MANTPTAAQRRQWSKIAGLGCIVDLENIDARCCSPAEIHHIETGGGGRKNHSRIIPVCHTHHRGAMGIHTMGRKAWREIYGTEQELFDKTMELLGVTS